MTDTLPPLISNELLGAALEEKNMYKFKLYDKRGKRIKKIEGLTLGEAFSLFRHWRGARGTWVGASISTAHVPRLDRIVISA